MASWFKPALKAVLPHVGTIIEAAKPIFTKPKFKSNGADAQPAQSDANDDALVASLQQQIAELQAAAAQNDAHIRDLAGQLQTTVKALEEAAATADAKVRRLTHLCLAALAVSVVSALISLILALPR